MLFVMPPLLAADTAVTTTQRAGVTIYPARLIQETNEALWGKRGLHGCAAMSHPLS